MSLFNNMGHLMKVLMQPEQHEESKNLADRAGVDKNDFSKIASVGLPLILQGMNRNNQNETDLKSFNEALNQHQDRNNYDSLNQFTKNVDAQDGDNILNHVFHDNKESISDGLAERIGVNPDTVKRTLAVLAPLAIKYLADRKKEDNLDPQGVQNETKKLTREATKQAQEQNNAEQGSQFGILGDLLKGLDGKTNSDKRDGGLLGNMFDLLK